MNYWNCDVSDSPTDEIEAIKHQYNYDDLPSRRHRHANQQIDNTNYDIIIGKIAHSHHIHNARPTKVLDRHIPAQSEMQNTNYSQQPKSYAIYALRSRKNRHS